MSFLSTFDHTNSMTDNIIDRDNLQDAYINEIIDGMDIKDLMRIVYDNLEQNLEQYSVDELIEEVEEYYPHLLEESNINWVSRGWTIWQPTHKIGTGVKMVYCIHMTKTQMTDTLQDLQDFMFDTMASKEMAVDWYCDRFEVNATDEVIDFVLDAHDAFFGN